MIALADPLAALLVAREPQFVREGQPPTDVVDPGANVGSAPVPSRTLAQWVTVDALPGVECETCGGSGGVCACSPGGFGRVYHVGDCGTFKPCPDCTSGRRPLAAGDRVRLVQGEWPDVDAMHGDWWVERHRSFTDADGDWWPEKCWALKDGNGDTGFYLPAPGTVVGEAVVDWMGPIHDRSTYEHWPHADFVLVERGKATSMRWDGVGAHDAYHSGWDGAEITGHGHVDWAPGRTAIRLREARAL